jgi:hypothetical protein
VGLQEVGRLNLAAQDLFDDQVADGAITSTRSP